jgi:hypothetical protein
MKTPIMSRKKTQWHIADKKQRKQCNYPDQIPLQGVFKSPIGRRDMPSPGPLRRPFERRRA